MVVIYRQKIGNLKLSLELGFSIQAEMLALEQVTRSER